MEINLNVEHLIDIVTSYCDYYEDYVKVNKGIEKGISGIDYYRWQEGAWETYSDILCLLNLDPEQAKRWWSAAKAIRKWRVKTNYEKCIPWELADRLYEFIFKGKGCDYFKAADLWV